MYSKPLTAAQLSGIATQQPINQQVGFAGLAGWIVSNSTPATFLIKDSNDTTQGVCAPWQITQGSFATASNDLYIVADYTWPMPNPQGIAAAQYQLSLETFTQSLSPSSQLLASASAIPAMALDQNGNAVVVFSGTQDVQFPAAQSVDANITGSVTLDSNSTIVNETLSMNPSVYAATETSTLTIPGNGYTSYFNAMYTPTGRNNYYDEFYVHLVSPGGNIANITLSLNGLYYHNPDFPVMTYKPAVEIPNKQTAGTTDALFGPFYCGSLLIGLFALQLNNTSTSAITDTFSAYVYCRYASANIVNPTSSPVYSQANSGGFGAATNINVTATLAPGATQTNQLTTSGGYITSMSFIVDDASGSGTLVLGSIITLSNGGEVFYTIQPDVGNMVFTIPVGNGIYDNGITVTFTAPSGNTNTSYDSISGIIVKTSTLGQPVPAVIV